MAEADRGKIAGAYFGMYGYVRVETPGHLVKAGIGVPVESVRREWGDEGARTYQEGMREKGQLVINFVPRVMSSEVEVDQTQTGQ